MSNRVKIGSGLLVLLLVLGGFLIRQNMRNDGQAVPPVTSPSFSREGTTPSATKSMPSSTITSSTITGSAPASSRASTTSGASRPVTSSRPAECMSTLTEIQPTTFRIDRMGVTSPMLALGEDESGAVAAPPKSASHTVGWWKNGPRVGSRKGNVVLPIHTYRNGGALGNELNQSSGLKPGDIIKMSDEAGQTQCYRMERELKIWVKDYDPNSKVLYDLEGAPQAVIVICWDFNRSSEEWDSRILFYLSPVAKG